MLMPLAGLAQSQEALQRPIKIAIAHFSHEATTFSPEKVGIDGFSKPNPAGERLLNFNEEIQGFVKFAREHAGVSLVPLESFGEVIGGSSKGWITKDAFEHYTGLILRDLKAALPVDAVYLSLHGAARLRVYPGPRPSWPGAYALSWARKSRSPARSILTATRTKNSCGMRTSRW